MRIPKMCLKQSLSYYKWYLQAILSLTVLSNCVQTLTPLYSLSVPIFVVFYSLLNRKFNWDSKNVLQTTIFSLQVRLQAILSLTVL